MKTSYRMMMYVVAAVFSLGAHAQSQTAEPATKVSGMSATAASWSHASKKIERAANRQFSKKVRQAIFKTKGLAGTEIVVFGIAATGQVTLAGFIDDQQQENQAMMAAEKVPGVKSVTSKLMVRENVH
ncbi:MULTISPECIES: BON domain-containing protein [Burkholderia]|uniref:BON domain-containing protein n=1 Tax=Burkholderia TaxID=32008 RepID=UPI001FC8030B|nr:MULTISPECIES: BON domain-containing protein [Burkholderia]